jgi:hypothetical protein
MENTLKNTIKNASVNDKIDQATRNAIASVHSLIFELNKASNNSIDSDSWTWDKYSANKICVHELEKAKDIIVAISNNCLNQ